MKKIDDPQTLEDYDDGYERVNLLCEVEDVEISDEDGE